MIHELQTIKEIGALIVLMLITRFYKVSDAISISPSLPQRRRRAAHTRIEVAKTTRRAVTVLAPRIDKAWSAIRTLEAFTTQQELVIRREADRHPMTWHIRRWMVFND